MRLRLLHDMTKPLAEFMVHGCLVIAALFLVVIVATIAWAIYDTRWNLSPTERQARQERTP